MENNILRTSKNNAKLSHSNSLIKKAIKFNFMTTVEYDQGYFFRGKRLLSASTITRPIFEHKMKGIPAHVLTVAKNRGKRLMENLQYWFDNQCEIKDIPFLSGEREKLIPIFEWLIKMEAKVLSVEKFIHNGEYCGFIDMIIKIKNVVYLVEIKTRSENIVEKTDLVQTYIYAKLFNGAPIIIMIIDNKNEVHTHSFDCRLSKVPFNKINEMYEFFGKKLPKINSIEIR